MSLRWKIYALSALVFIAAALRWRSNAVGNALALAVAESDKRALEAITRAQEARYNVENMDDEHLRRIAAKWVRDKNP